MKPTIETKFDSQEEKSHTLKIVLVGNSKVGKTTFLEALTGTGIAGRGYSASLEIPLEDKNSQMKDYYVYILVSRRNGILYIGFTDDLQRRVKEHREKSVSGFTAKYNVNMLVYYETISSSDEAFLRERRLKKWKKRILNGMIWLKTGINKIFSGFLLTQECEYKY